MNNRRQSNIELLRIVSMFMIVSFHYIEYGVMRTDNADAYIRWYSGTIVNKLISSFFACGGDTGVGVFFIIMGYFLFKRMDTKLPDSIIRKLYYYGWINAIVILLLRHYGHNEVAALSALRSLFLPISGSTWWFASVYIILLFLYPQINSLLNRIDDKRRYVTIIIIMWGIWYIGGKALDVMYYRILRGVFYYLIGTYIAKFDNKSKKLGYYMFGMSWIMYTLLTFLIGTIVGGGYHYFLLANLFKLIRRTVLGPISAFGLFIVFKNRNSQYSPTINRLAEGTFGIYLLHDAPGIKVLLFDYIFKVSGISWERAWFPLYMIFVVFIIMIIGLIVDEFQRYLDRRICRAVFNS